MRTDFLFRCWRLPLAATLMKLAVNLTASYIACDRSCVLRAIVCVGAPSMWRAFKSIAMHPMLKCSSARRLPTLHSFLGLMLWLWHSLNGAICFLMCASCCLWSSHVFQFALVPLGLWSNLSARGCVGRNSHDQPLGPSAGGVSTCLNGAICFLICASCSLGSLHVFSFDLVPLGLWSSQSISFRTHSI